MCLEPAEGVRAVVAPIPDLTPFDPTTLAGTWKGDVPILDLENSILPPGCRAPSGAVVYIPPFARDLAIRIQTRTCLDEGAPLVVSALAANGELL